MVKNSETKEIIVLQNRNKIKSLIIFILFVFITFSCGCSYIKFNCINFVVAGIGLWKIIFLNTEYVEIQEYPQVVIAKPDGAKDNLIKYMDNEDFMFKEQMGSMMIFENNLNIEQFVSFELNKYYSKWVWQ